MSVHPDPSCSLHVAKKHTPMTDLIVDFPSCRSVHRKTSSAKTAPRPKKTVHFAPMADIKFIERIGGADSSPILWYSQRDYVHMKVSARQAAIDAYDRSIMRSPSEVDDDLDRAVHDCMLTLLAPSVVKKSKATRVKCVRAVLMEQERQDRIGRCDPIGIALSSRHYSEPASKRAHSIGLVVSK